MHGVSNIIRRKKYIRLSLIFLNHHYYTLSICNNRLFQILSILLLSNSVLTTATATTTTTNNKSVRHEYLSILQRVSKCHNFDNGISIHNFSIYATYHILPIGKTNTNIIIDTIFDNNIYEIFDVCFDEILIRTYSQ